MDNMTLLIAGSVAFVGTHIIMSHLLRTQLIGILGNMGYMIVYSLVSFATFGPAIYAYGKIPPEAPLWAAPYFMSVVCAFLMFMASVLFIGSQVKNPAMPMPGASEIAKKQPHGVFKITRHPMMWSFAIWGSAHILVKPTTANLWLMGSVIILAIWGSLGQDRRKTREMGESWQHWQANTSFIPFGNGLVSPGSGIIIVGIAFWMIASWAHHGLGYAMVPPWTNLWGVSAP